MAILFVATVSRRAVRSSPDRVPVSIDAVAARTRGGTGRLAEADEKIMAEDRKPKSNVLYFLSSCWVKPVHVAPGIGLLLAAVPYRDRRN
jgi:hypothetical protein